jgi:hypothetical protein
MTAILYDIPRKLDRRIKRRLPQAVLHIGQNAIYAIINGKGMGNPQAALQIHPTKH